MRFGPMRAVAASVVLAGLLGAVVLAVVLQQRAAGSTSGPARALVNAPRDTYRLAGIRSDEVLPGKVCARCVDRWLVPSDSMVARALRNPPVRLFRESFEALSRSAIESKWLPETLDDAKFVAVGEGAFRARTARMFSIYRRDGAHVILQGFPGEVLLIVKPSPFPLPAEAVALVRHSAGTAEPAGGVQPYASGAKIPPRSIEAAFRAICEEVLTQTAQPQNDDTWAQGLRLMVNRDGWLRIWYRCSPLDDPGVTKSTCSGVDIWTNGKVVRIAVWSTCDPEIHMEGSPLLKALRPTTDTPVQLIPAVSRVATLNEWTDPNQALVPSPKAATHQWFYIRLGSGRLYSAWVPLARRDDTLQVAQWVALAQEVRSTVHQSVSNVRYVYQIRKIAEESGSAAALAWLRKQCEACVSSLKSLRSVPCPKPLASDCEKTLEALAMAPAMCDMGWSAWRDALNQPGDAPVDYEAVGERIRLSLSEKQAAAAALGNEANRALREQMSRLNMCVDEDIYRRL